MVFAAGFESRDYWTYLFFAMIPLALQTSAAS
jgi:hypothetical protein